MFTMSIMFMLLAFHLPLQCIDSHIISNRTSDCEPISSKVEGYTLLWHSLAHQIIDQERERTLTRRWCLVICGQYDLPRLEEFWPIFRWLAPNSRLGTLLRYNWWSGPDGHEVGGGQQDYTFGIGWSLNKQDNWLSNIGDAIVVDKGARDGVYLL